MRGKLALEVRAIREERIIPARAGQTPGMAGGARAASDHPRACGANGQVLSMILWQHGSSPRVRGKRIVPQCPQTTCRIIPARAGQTMIPSSGSRP